MKDQNLNNHPDPGVASRERNEEKLPEHPVMAVKPEKKENDENPHELNTEETNDEDKEEFASTSTEKKDSERDDDDQSSHGNENKGK